MYLDKSSKVGASLSGVTLEASAKSSVVVALSAASTLEGVVVGRGRLDDIRRSVGVGDKLISKTGNLGGATITTGVGDNLKKVLLSVDTLSGESNGDIQTSTLLVTCLVRVDSDGINNLVRKVHKSSLNSGAEGSKATSGSSSKSNGDSGVSLVVF